MSDISKGHAEFREPSPWRSHWIALPLILAVGACAESKDKPANASTCTAGPNGACACVPGARCDDEQVCFSTLCETRAEWTVQVEVEDARACDLLFELAEHTRFVAASWSEGVLGHAETRGPLVGAALISDADVPLPQVPLTLHGTGNDVPTVRLASCADRMGQPLPTPTVRVTP